MKAARRYNVCVGTAGWAIPSAFASHFPPGASHLGRYAEAFNGVEINSSFYRDHREETYARWAASVPEEFRFSVKLSREVTHERGLDVERAVLREKIAPVLALGKKLGVILIQLLPGLVFSRGTVRRFFGVLRREWDGEVALEPRHESWASTASRGLLREFAISKVLADPERCPIGDFASETAGGFFYLRLHGAPIVYRSRYSEGTLSAVSEVLAEAARRIPGWCIFDNTTFGWATHDAATVREAVIARERPRLSEGNVL